MDINLSGVISAENNASETIKDAADVAGQQVGQVAKNAGKTIEQITNEGQKVIVNALLSAFDNFVPKKPSKSYSGWITSPIIVATISNIIAFILLLIVNIKNIMCCYPLIIILLLVSFVFNIISFFFTFSLFPLVFNVIEAFPGIAKIQSGASIILSGFSLLFLFISLSIVIVDAVRNLKILSINKNSISFHRINNIRI